MTPTLPEKRRTPYRNSKNTDVSQTFKQFGWTEPDRGRQRVEFMRLNDLDFRLAELLKAQIAS